MVTITIPDTLYAKAQRIAENNGQSVDDVIQQLLSASLENPRLSLPEDEQNELNALAFLTDTTLWTIAREQMPQSVQDTMQHLMDKNTSGTITANEKTKLESLVENGQRLTLRKAEAVKILIQRGQHVTLDDMTPDNYKNL